MSKKKQRDLELFIVDIFVAVHKIKRYTLKFNNAEDLRFDSLHWDATIRELEIIGESLNNLLKDESFLKKAPKYFRKVVNFRNAISHGYFGIDEEEVWSIIKNRLDILIKDTLYICENLIDLSTAIETQILEYKRLKDVDTVEFLYNIKKKPIN